MRIPYPERLKWKSMLLYAVLLFVGEIATGTDIWFALLMLLFIVLFTAAVNKGGGLYYASGAYIFFNGALLILVGATYKVFLLEPGQSNLLAPITTMLAYCGGMAAMWAAVEASKRLTPRRGLLASFVNDQTMMQSAIGCFVLGTLLVVAFGGGIQQGGSIGAAVSETNRFPQFAIMLGVTYELRKSSGRRAWNWVVVTQLVILFALGVIASSKEGMFMGPVTWAVAAIAGGYNFKPRMLLMIGGFTFFMLYYMVPYSQYVRNFRDKEGSRAANQAVALQYIFHLNDVRELYLQQYEDPTIYTGGPHFFDRSQGIVDRLTAVGMDDAIVDRTQQGFVFGLYPTYHGIINTVPTFLWKNKPQFFGGNEYGRELGVLSPDDTSTGIAFSPQADAFHQARWFGIFVVMPLVCFTYFLANDTFAGSVRDSPWPLLLVILASHLAPEGGLDTMLLQVVEGSIGLFFMATVIRYVLPLVVRVMSGGEKTIVRKGMDFRLGGQPIARPEATEPAAAGSANP